MHKVAIRWLMLTLVVGFGSSTPVIVLNPVDTNVLEGDDVTLQCVVEDLPQDHANSVQWIRGTFALGNDRNISFNKRYSMVGDIRRGEYNLNIKHANVVEDDNTYECQVTKYGLQSNSARLNVLVEPSGPFVDDAKTIDDVLKVDVVVGKESELTCRAIGGKPPASLQWFKNQVKVADGGLALFDGPVDKLFNTSATIRVAPTTDESSSVYTCLMTSEASNQEKRITVQLNLLEPPKVSVFFAEKIYENSNFDAECRSYASPAVLDYRWYVKDVLQTGKTTPDIFLGVVNRTWHGVKIGCEARNAAGYSERSEKEINVFYAPVSLDYKDKIEADIGQNVTFSCLWDSNPASKVAWTLEGSDVVLGRSTNLLLTDVKQKDTGFYKCTATVDETKYSNSVTSQLIVNGPPLFSDDLHQTAVLGEMGIVRCSLSSYPGINQVVWSWKQGKESTTLQGNGTSYTTESGATYRGKFEPGSPFAELEILKVTKEDLHSYKCYVKNSYGDNSVEIFLNEDMHHAGLVFVTNITIAACVGGAVLLLLILIIACCCYRKKRQQKSTNFDEKTKKLEYTPAKVIGGDEMIMMNREDEPTSGAYKVRSSSSSQDDEQASIDQEHENPPHPFGMDDGYHTEEAYSWNRSEPQEKIEPDSNPPQNLPANNFRVEYVDLPSENADYKIPLLDSQQYPNHPRSMQVRTPVSAFRSASALGGRFSPSFQFQRHASDVSSHAPSMYSAVPTEFYPTMTNYPDLVSPYSQASFYTQPPPTLHPHYPRNQQLSYEASQSSLDHLERESALSGSNVPRHIEGRNLHSRMSQSSKSSEFTRPLVARMATHV